MSEPRDRILTVRELIAAASGSNDRAVKTHYLAEARAVLRTLRANVEQAERAVETIETELARAPYTPKTGESA